MQLLLSIKTSDIWQQALMYYSTASYRQLVLACLCHIISTQQRPKLYQNL